MKNRIKELREQKRISQVCLATHIGCSQNTISKMELEMSEPKASQLLEMAKYFNVSVDYILCNSDYKYIQEVYHNAKLIELTDGQRIPVSEDQHKKIREQYSRFIRKDIFND